MLCDNCKENEATVHYQQIINGKSSETHLCDKCASEKGMITFSFNKQPSVFGNLLSGFMEEEAAPYGEEGKEAPKVACRCGWTNVDLKKTGFLGCPACYRTFKKILSPLLRKIHGSSHHIGKIPSKVPVKEKIIGREIIDSDMKRLRECKQQLQSCIQEEKYEEAAKLRDEIKKIEKEFH